MIVYTEKIENAILMAAAHGSIQYRGRGVKFSDITKQIMEDLVCEYAQFGFLKTEIPKGERTEKALFVWGEHLFRMKAAEELGADEIKENDKGDAFLPKNLIFVPMPGKESAAELLKTLLNNEDHTTVYNACIGENAIYTFIKAYEYAGLNNKDKKIYRVEIDKMLENEIQEAFQNKKNETASMNEMIAEKEKRYILWICNINLNAALYEKFGDNANVPFRYLPILHEIVQRKKNRQRQSDAMQYRVTAQAAIEAESFSLSNKELTFNSEQEANTLLRSLPPAGNIEKISEEIITEYAPGPFNNKAMIEKMARHRNAKFSAEKTQKLLQSLYEKGYITNINAKSRKYAAYQKHEIDAILTMLSEVNTFRSMLQGADLLEIPNDFFKSKDNECGIIVTQKRPTQKELTKEESLLYAIIAKEMIKTAYPPLKLKRKQCAIRAGNAVFFAEEKETLLPGFTQLEEKTVDKKIFPLAIAKGQTVKLTYAVEPVKASALPFYSEQDIIRKFTPVKKAYYTASEITYGINLLLQREFILRKEKKLLSTELGESIELYLQEQPTLLNGNLLSGWNHTLKQIKEEQDETNAIHLAESLNDSVHEALESFRAALKETQGVQTAIPCPRCQTRLSKSSVGFKCQACGWKIPQTLSGRTFTERELAYLIHHKSTPIIKGFSNGERNVRGRIYLDDKLQPQFTEDSQFSCPVCGRKLHVSSDGTKYLCPSESCSFVVLFRYFGHELSNDELKALLTERISPVITNFRNEKGGFSGRLYIDPSKDYAVRIALIKK